MRVSVIEKNLINLAERTLFDTKPPESGELNMKLSTTPYILLLICIAIIVLQQTCIGNKEKKLEQCLNNPPIQIDTIVQADKIVDTIEIDRPVPYAVVRSDTTVLTYIDTHYVLGDYFASRYYNDTLLNDSSAFLAVLDTVSENALQGRSLHFKNKRPKVLRVTKEVPTELKFRVLAGGFVEGADRLGAGVSVGYIPKNDNYVAQYSYDVLNNRHRVGLMWKLRFRK